MLRPKKTWIKSYRQVSLPSLIGIVVTSVIVAFLLGVVADDTKLGRAITASFYEKISNVGSTEGLPDDLDYTEVEELYDTLRSNFEGNLAEEKLIDGLKKGLAASTGDPYTVYLNEEESKKFLQDLNNELSGIGAEIAIKNNQLQIVSPLSGSPAEKAELQPGDMIFQINGEDTLGMFLEEAVSKIRGEAGSEVTLTIGRKGKVFEVKIVRAEIKVPNAESEIMDGNIGYLKINTFGNHVEKEVAAIVEDFRAKNVKGVVLDLRNNGGGLLEASIDIAGLWLDSDVVLKQEGRVEDTIRSRGTGRLRGVPTVVLINEGSASASEIVAGALKDNKVATVVGEKSFGKGSVQTLEDLRSGGQLKVTIARWFTPNGNSIDQEGIEPEIKIELSEEDFDNDRDPQLNRALELLKK